MDQIHENYAEQYNILKMKLQKEIQVWSGRARETEPASQCPRWGSYSLHAEALG